MRKVGHVSFCRPVPKRRKADRMRRRVRQQQNRIAVREMQAIWQSIEDDGLID